MLTHSSHDEGGFCSLLWVLLWDHAMVVRDNRGGCRNAHVDDVTTEAQAAAAPSLELPANRFSFDLVITIFEQLCMHSSVFNTVDKVCSEPNGRSRTW